MERRNNKTTEICRGGSVHGSRRHMKEDGMDARYNWLIDSAAVRLTLNTLALVVWIAVSVGLLELAAKA